MEVFHDSALYGGHQCSFKTYQSVIRYFWWKFMRKDITNYTNKCYECQINKRGSDKHFGDLKPIRSSNFMEKIGLDFMGLFPETIRRNKWILVCINHFSKRVIAKALPDSKSETVAKFLIEDVISHHGLPKEIITDQGAQFRSGIIKDLLRLMGIRKHQTAPYYPQCNGTTERVNDSIIQSLKNYVNTNQGNWDQLLP